VASATSPPPTRTRQSTGRQKLRAAITGPPRVGVSGRPLPVGWGLARRRVARRVARLQAAPRLVQGGRGGAERQGAEALPVAGRMALPSGSILKNDAVVSAGDGARGSRKRA